MNRQAVSAPAATTRERQEAPETGAAGMDPSSGEASGAATSTPVTGAFKDFAS